MLISHEVPLTLLKESRKFNDYDYALVHLFPEDDEYLAFYKESVKLGRHVLLDNSIFELEVAWDADDFARWVVELNPTEYIVPDVLNDMDATIFQAQEWLTDHSDLPQKKIGVIQGNTYEEVVECYKFHDRYMDKIAIPFNIEFFESRMDAPNEYYTWMYGRQWLINKLLEDGVMNVNKPHHLLGASLPQEFTAYRNMPYLESVDTSNPVVHGLNGITYNETGLSSKTMTKLITYMDMKREYIDVDSINHNIKSFRNIVKGDL